MKIRLLMIVIGILTLSLIIVADNFEKYAYAGCAATILPEPCFDSFMGSHEPMTQKSIMEDFARNIELNFGDWQMSDRKWDDENTPLQLPAIICTEFVVDGMKHYRMAKWVDSHRISSFEDHRNDFLCNKWLAPIDDGVKIKWDKPNYLPNDVGIVTVTDKEMNQDSKKLDSFDIHVWSDTDHTGIRLTITETEIDNGIFKGTVFLTPDGESEGTRLLVEDAIYAEHKSSINFVRITSEQFVYDSTFNPESEKSREQLERYCVLDDKPNLKDELFYNNSTHFLSSKTCAWLEMPACGTGTTFVNGVCHVVKTKTTSGDCLIATASYGSELSPQVQMLREIRDNTLLNTESGKIFMTGFNSIYYSFSPTIAQWENQNYVFKELVKLFITPMIATLSIMTIADDSEIQVILYGLSTIGLIVGMYVVVPVALVWKIKKIK